jgi:hypothetical protein
VPQLTDNFTCFLTPVRLVGRRVAGHKHRHDKNAAAEDEPRAKEGDLPSELRQWLNGNLTEGEI